MGQSSIERLDELGALVPHVADRAIDREPLKIVNNPAVILCQRFGQLGERFRRADNYTAKRLLSHTGGVVDICDVHNRNWVQRNTAVSEVWGVPACSILRKPGTPTALWLNCIPHQRCALDDQGGD